MLNFADATPKREDKRSAGYSDDLLSFDFQSQTQSSPQITTNSTPTQNVENLDPVANTMTQTDVVPPAVPQTSDPFDIFAGSGSQTQTPIPQSTSSNTIQTTPTQTSNRSNTANFPSQTDTNSPAAAKMPDPFGIFADSGTQTSRSNPFDTQKANSNPFDTSANNVAQTHGSFDMSSLRQETSNASLEPQSFDNPFTAPAVTSTQRFPSSVSIVLYKLNFLHFISSL